MRWGSMKPLSVMEISRVLGSGKRHQISKRPPGRQRSQAATRTSCRTPSSLRGSVWSWALRVSPWTWYQSWCRLRKGSRRSMARLRRVVRGMGLMSVVRLHCSLRRSCSRVLRAGSRGCWRALRSWSVGVLAAGSRSWRRWRLWVMLRLSSWPQKCLYQLSCWSRSWLVWRWAMRWRDRRDQAVWLMRMSASWNSRSVQGRSGLLMPG